MCILHKCQTQRYIDNDEVFYLRHYVAKEAAVAIAGLPTSEAFYADVVELLNNFLVIVK